MVAGTDLLHYLNFPTIHLTPQTLGHHPILAVGV
jgi:hypothetical protein